MSRRVQKQLKELQPGDLIRVEWNDASIGTAYSGRPNVDLDVGVLSVGLFVSIMGKKKQHILLAQNSFRFTDEHYRIDYTLVPVSWAINIGILKKSEIDSETAKVMMQCFLRNGGHVARGVRQRRTENFGS